MSFLWFSAGVLTDFDNYLTDGTYVQQSTLGSRTGLSIKIDFDRVLYKILPETASELWASMYCNVTSVSDSNASLRLLKTDHSTILCKVQVEGNNVVAYANIGGTLTKIGTGTTILATGTAHQIETHYKRDATAGILEVWVDNILEISFAGNTGAATDLIQDYSISNVSGYTNNFSYVSEMIATNKGKIGKKRMQLLYTSGVGDVNTSDGFMDVVGNNSTTTSTAVKTGTWIFPSAAKASGTVSAVSFKLSAADTVKVGVFTKNPSSVKFTPDAVRQATVACLAGVVTLNGGNEIPAWNIAAGEYIGIYTAAGTLIGQTGYDYGDGDGYTLFYWYTYAGDVFAVGTELAYSTTDQYTAAYAYFQYLTPTNILYLYNNNIGVITEKPWQESKRYIAFSADQQEFLSNCTDIVDSECTAVNALKITLRGEAGSDLLNGQASIKLNGTTTYSDIIAMPSVVNKRHAVFEGTWSKTSINALQIGFKART